MRSLLPRRSHERREGDFVIINIGEKGEGNKEVVLGGDTLAILLPSER